MLSDITCTISLPWTKTYYKNCWAPALAELTRGLIKTRVALIYICYLKRREINAPEKKITFYFTSLSSVFTSKSYGVLLLSHCVFILYWSFKNTTWPTRMFQDDGLTLAAFVAWMLYTHWQDNAGYSNSSPLSIYSLHIFTFHAYLLPLPFCFSSWMQLSLYRLSSMSLACLALFIMAQQGVLMIPCHLATSVSPSL